MSTKNGGCTSIFHRLFTPDNAIFTASALLLSLPILLGMLYIRAFGVNIPYWDEWGLVPLIDKFYSHSLTLGDLFAQHNEHRIFFPQLIMLASAYFTHYNTVVDMYLSYLLACASLALLFIVFTRRFKRITRALILFIPVSWMFFNFNQWENILWGYQISVYLCIFGLVASLFLLEKSEKPGLEFLLSILFAIVSSFSFINGLMSWPAGLLLILISKAESRWKLAVPWTLAGIAVWAVYFYGWVKPSYHPSLLYPVLHPGGSALYFFTIIGGVITSYSFAAIAAGMVIISLSILVIWLAVKDRTFKENGFWLSLVIFALLTAFLCVLGRSGFGVDQALSSRYITLMIPGMLGIYMIACALMKKRPESIGRFIVFSILLVIMATGIMSGYLTGYPIGKAIMETRTNTIDTVKNYQNVSDDALKATYPDPAIAREDIRLLEKYRLSVFS